MNTHTYLSPRLLAGAAIVGLVGAAGVFIYEQVYAEKRRAMLAQEVQRLDRQVCSMRTELESLRELQKETHLRRLKQRKIRKREAVKPTFTAIPSGGDTVDAPEKSYTSDSEYLSDYQSIAGTDAEMDSEEFYDVHTDDDSDDTLRGNGQVRNIDPLEDDDDISLSDKNGSTKRTSLNAT